MELKLPVALIAMLILASSNNAHAALLVNGGFESPILAPGAFLTIGVGGEPVGFGWTVTSGNVDVGYTPIDPFVDYPAMEGNQGLDLNGTTRGAISQTFATVIGQAYRLSFGYADNPFEGGISSADVKVTDVGTLIDLISTSITHSTSNNGTAAPGDGDADGDLFSAVFIATGTSTKLSFASTSASASASGGIFLDAVDVSETTIEVPEPGSMMLLSLGAVSALGLRRRNQRATVA